MAKKKPLKLMKTLHFRRDGFAGQYADYELSSSADKPTRMYWSVDAIKALFGRVLCPAGKTATVKITIEVEKVE